MISHNLLNLNITPHIATHAANLHAVGIELAIEKLNM